MVFGVFLFARILILYFRIFIEFNIILLYTHVIRRDYIMTDEEQKKIFSKNLNYYIENSGKQQKRVASDLGISPTTFNTWCVGKIMPRMGKVQAIADYFSIDKSDLTDDKSKLIGKQTQNGIVISVLDHVTADIPIETVKDIVDTEEITEELAKTGDFFALQIKGNSMEPKFSEGDVVIVRQQDDAESGDIVIVTINSSDAVCKRLKKYNDSIALISTNPDYDPMIFSSEEIESEPVRIIGRVVELRAKF